MTTTETVIERTRTWLEKAVIGLNLCPFAKAVYQNNLIRFHVSEATTPELLRDDLVRELQLLMASEIGTHDTTLLIHPHTLQDFLDYNDFLDLVDSTLIELDLEGVFQVASFHPQYQFDGTTPDDITNCTNRSPYPMLHLLREASVEEALDSYPDAEQIVERNLETMRRLGHRGWDELGR